MDAQTQRMMETTYKSLRWSIVLVALAFLTMLLIYRSSETDAVHRCSISAYYHNQGICWPPTWIPVQDLFVGVFAALGLMLYAYKGYSPLESRLLNVAAIGLLVVAACPMEWTQPKWVATDIAQSMSQNEKKTECLEHALTGKFQDQAKNLKHVIHHSHDEGDNLAKSLPETQAQDHWPKTWKGRFHYLGAFTFFICIACTCWLCSNTTLKDNRYKGTYKTLYVIMGIAMILFPVIAVVITVILDERDNQVFWIEFSSVFAFALYWAIKSVEINGYTYRIVIFGVFVAICLICVVCFVAGAV